MDCARSVSPRQTPSYFSKTGESDFYIRDIKIESEIPFLPISVINEFRRNALEELMRKRMTEYKRAEQKPMEYVPYYKKELDYRANVHNFQAQNFYERCGALVSEMSFEKKALSHQIELMRTKHCIKYALNMCKSPEKLVLEDEFGKVYPLRFDCKCCEMIVLSP